MKQLLLACIALPSIVGVHATEAPDELREAALAFLRSLDDPARERARVAFDEPERENWSYVPKAREGLPLGRMNESQTNAAVGLANAVLSERGAFKAAQIISLESVLAELEGNPESRNPGNYYVSVFGEPVDPEGWGFRFEGHHLSLNITIVGEKVSVTPTFFGANPAEVRDGPQQGLRPLAAEEDLARALAVSLAEAEQPVVFSNEAPAEIVTSNDRIARRPEPVGVAVTEMDAKQRDQLLELIGNYLGNFHPEVANAELARIEKDGIDAVRFGWAGSTSRGEAFYYRVQGESFLMEAANTQNDANHIHTVWRKFDGDFGRDLLREHHEAHEH